MTDKELLEDMQEIAKYLKTIDPKMRSLLKSANAPKKTSTLLAVFMQTVSELSAFMIENDEYFPDTMIESIKRVKSAIDQELQYAQDLYEACHKNRTIH
jgi:hypothetical protein